MSTDDPFDDPGQQTAVARCNQCGQFVAKYMRGRGWDLDGRQCRCDRQPVLPTPPGRRSLRV